MEDCEVHSLVAGKIICDLIGQECLYEYPDAARCIKDHSREENLVQYAAEKNNNANSEITLLLI